MILFKDMRRKYSKYKKVMRVHCIHIHAASHISPFPRPGVHNATTPIIVWPRREPKATICSPAYVRGRVQLRGALALGRWALAFPLCGGCQGLDGRKDVRRPYVLYKPFVYPVELRNGDSKQTAIERTGGEEERL
jgi:hypothetical protein